MCATLVTGHAGLATREADGDVAPLPMASILLRHGVNAGKQPCAPGYGMAWHAMDLLRPTLSTAAHRGHWRKTQNRTKNWTKWASGFTGHSVVHQALYPTNWSTILARARTGSQGRQRAGQHFASPRPLLTISSFPVAMRMSPSSQGFHVQMPGLVSFYARRWQKHFRQLSSAVFRTGQWESGRVARLRPWPARCGA